MKYCVLEKGRTGEVDPPICGGSIHILHTSHVVADAYSPVRLNAKDPDGPYFLFLLLKSSSIVELQPSQDIGRMRFLRKKYGSKRWATLS